MSRGSSSSSSKHGKRIRSANVQPTSYTQCDWYSLTASVACLGAIGFGPVGAAHAFANHAEQSGDGPLGTIQWVYVCTDGIWGRGGGGGRRGSCGRGRGDDGGAVDAVIACDGAVGDHELVTACVVFQQSSTVEEVHAFWPRRGWPLVGFFTSVRQTPCDKRAHVSGRFSCPVSQLLHLILECAASSVPTSP